MKIAAYVVLYKTSREEILRIKKEFHEKNIPLQCIDNSRSDKGYAYAANKALKNMLRTNCKFCILANPDISLNTISVGSVNKAAQHFDIFGFAMEQNGKKYYGGEIDKWRMSGGLIEKKPKKRYTACDFVGSFMVIKKEVIEKIGLFNERYFMYYEDVEYCERARRAGFKVGIDSQTWYEHFENSKSNKKKDWYLFRNRILFLLEYGSWQQKLYELIRVPKTLYETIS